MLYRLAICIGCKAETVTRESCAQSTKVRHTPTCHEPRGIQVGQTSFVSQKADSYLPLRASGHPFTFRLTFRQGEMKGGTLPKL
jgi:hypothetical protein